MLLAILVGIVALEAVMQVYISRQERRQNAEAHFYQIEYRNV